MECQFCDSVNTHEVELLDWNDEVSVHWFHCDDCDSDFDVRIPYKVDEE